MFKVIHYYSKKGQKWIKVGYLLYIIMYRKYKNIEEEND